MIRVTSIEMDWKPNAGCNNGVLSDGVISFSDGSEVKVTTCRCGRGCGGTDVLPGIGYTFEDIVDFWQYANPYY